MSEFMSDFVRRLHEENESKREWNRQWAEHFSVCMEHAANARKHEQAGNLQDAISNYWRAVLYAQEHSEYLYINNYAHSLERLAVLYRKMKDYAHEVEVCEMYVELTRNDKDRARFQQRLDKARTLLAKQQQP